MAEYTLMVGDCVERLKELPDASIDAVVTDPPYGLSFMGKAWDHSVPSAEVWSECLRVLKPGGHLLAFAGTRTQHRMAVNIEDAGFEIRDMIAWVYGSGFPKSHDVSKAIDKSLGAKGEYLGPKTAAHATRKSLKVPDGWDRPWMSDPEALNRANSAYCASTPEAQQWNGWGTALKPALEPITVARKPFKGTVADNVLTHGTGAINVDGCRVETDEKLTAGGSLGVNTGDTRSGKALGMFQEGTPNTFTQNPSGRFPANFIHDGSEEVVGLFPVTGPAKAASRGLQHSGRHGGLADIGRNIKEGTDTVRGHNDNGGSAARFFYCAKASKRDRDEGLDGFDPKRAVKQFNEGMEGKLRSDGTIIKPAISHRNNHPTVKPTDLMRYLVRMVTPPNGTVLDPFTGSGSTGKACMLEGFNFVGCELSDEYAEIAKARIEHAKNLKPELTPQKDMFSD